MIDLKKHNFLKSGKISIIVYIIVALLIIVSGFINLVLTEDEFAKNKDIAIQRCIDECKLQHIKEISLEDGPCLSREIVLGWACDVSHDPKIRIVDNNPLNQCESYIKKDVKHLVEVTKKCELISAK